MRSVRDSSSSLYELLEREGLISLESVLELETWPVKRLREFHERLADRIFNHQYDCVSDTISDEYYKFLAGTSLRGDTCWELPCRAPKLDFLARFAALYSDAIVLPLPLSSSLEGKLKPTIAAELSRSVFSLNMLRPLVEEGIVAPAVLRTQHCEHRIEFAQELTSFMAEVAVVHADEARDKFNLWYVPPHEDDPRYSVLIESSDDLLQHGGFYINYPKEPSWVAKSWRVGSDGRVKIPGRTAWKTGLIQKIFRDRAGETTFQLTYGRSMRCKYLTTMPGEVEILKWFLDEEQEQRHANLASSFLHELPYVQDVSLRDLLKLRTEIRDSFQQYRSAIRLALRDFQQPLTRA